MKTIRKNICFYKLVQVLLAIYFSGDKFGVFLHIVRSQSEIFDQNHSNVEVFEILLQTNVNTMIITNSQDIWNTN